MTNYERIKQMSAEQMADCILTIVDCCHTYGYDGSGCDDCPLNDKPCRSRVDLRKWLESEADEE